MKKIATDAPVNLRNDWYIVYSRSKVEILTRAKHPAEGMVPGLISNPYCKKMPLLLNFCLPTSGHLYSMDYEIWGTLESTTCTWSYDETICPGTASSTVATLSRHLQPLIDKTLDHVK